MGAGSPQARPLGPLLTLEMLSSPGQEVVKDVEGPLLLGLADGTRLLQEIFANIKELCMQQRRHFPYPGQKQLNLSRWQMAK